VDSAVAALRLLEQGYEVVGLLLDIPYARSPLREAQQVADALGIPLLHADVAEAFAREVVGYFIDEYAAGRTPNPCVRCNPAVKFAALTEAADRLGAAHIATGHYAGLRRQGDKTLLLRSGGPKDQSYMLHRLTQAQLARLLLPLQGMDKTEVRALAAGAGLEVAGRPDSQELCFIPDNDRVAFLERHGPKLPPGDIVDPQGRPLGRHGGLWRHTVGQRRGLGLSAEARQFVTALSPADNRVVLGPEQDLYRRQITVGRLHLISGEPLTAPLRVTARVRYGRPETGALLTPLGGDRAQLDFDAPVRAPAPGQSAVFYQGEVVLGGGEIEAPVG